MQAVQTTAALFVVLQQIGLEPCLDRAGTIQFVRRAGGQRMQYSLSRTGQDSGYRLRFRQPLQRPDEIGARQQELAAAPAVDDSVVLSCSGDELHAEVSLPATTLEEVPVALLQGLKQLHRGVRDFHNCGCG